MADITLFDAETAVNDYITTPKEPARPTTGMQINIANFAGRNPDEEAEIQKISKRTGVPVEALSDKKVREKVVRENAIAGFDFEGYAALFPTSAKFMADPDVAKISHDDVETMGMIEATLRTIGRAGTAIKSGTAMQFPAGVWGSLEIAAKNYARTTPLGMYDPYFREKATGRSDDIPYNTLDYAADFFGRQRRANIDASNVLMQPIMEDAGFLERNFYSGMQSVGVNLPGMLASVATRNPTYALTFMGATTGGLSAGRGLDEGLDPLTAGIYGMADAAVEVGTELIPLTRFINDLTGGTSLGKTILTNIALEVPGELLATTLQNFNEWAFLNPDEPFSTYLDALPTALADTVVATVAAAGVQSGAMTLTSRGIQRISGRMENAQSAVDNAQSLEELQQLARASEVLGRDADTFEKFIEQATDGHDIHDVYIDINELKQSGVDLDALSEVSPSTAKQRAVAEETGGLLKIPVSEFTTYVAPTDIGPRLIDVLRTDPFAMSRKEATEFMQSGAEQFQAEVEKELSETADKIEKSQSRKNVEERILQQLTDANRFTADVNRPYATFMGNFFETAGARTGRTAEEMFAAYPVAIRAEGPSGEDTLSQERAWKNELGLFSKVEQEVLDANIPGWKGATKGGITEDEQIRLSNLGGMVMTPTLMAEKEELQQKARVSQGLANGSEIWQKIASLPVKKEELDWLGLEDFLKSGDKFTRQDVVDFIRKGGVKVEEVVADAEAGDNVDGLDVYNGTPWTDPEAWEHRIEDIVEEAKSNPEDYVRQQAIFDVYRANESEILAAVPDSTTGADQDPPLSVLEKYAEENYPEEVEQRIQELASDQAKEEYYDNPYMLYQADLGDNGVLVIFGNEDIGFDVRQAGVGWNVQEDGVPPRADIVIDGGEIYSLAEAEIQAEEYARENGLIEDTMDESVARWGDYITPGAAENYREIKLTLPELEGSYFKEAHFPDRNVVAFLRVTDRDLALAAEVEDALVLPDNIGEDLPLDNLVVTEVNRYTDAFGETNIDYTVKTKQGRVMATFPVKEELTDEQVIERYVASYKYDTERQLRAKAADVVAKKTFFVDEFQSDWHQEGRKTGYSAGGVDTEVLGAEIYDLRRRIIDQFEGVDNDNFIPIYNAAITGDMSLLTHSVNKHIAEDPEFIDAAQSYKDLKDKFDAEEYGPPDAPFKGDNWLSLGLKRALVHAAENNYQRFAWADADVLKGRWSERYSEMYDTQYDKKMPSAIKKLTKQNPVHVTDSEDLEGAGYWYVDLTPELRQQILDEGFSLFQKEQDTRRGSFNPATSTIAILQAADLSTFLHESAHFFLETMNKVAQEQSAPQQIKDDMQTVFDWFGVSDIEEWNSKSLEEQREAHEQFARGFEAYLMEGKAPSIELQSIFQRFRAWLINVYKDLRNLRVDLNDDVRRVFDRMLATDEIISEAQNARGFSPLFKSAEEAGMSQQEWEAYQELGREATAEATQLLDARSLRDMRWLSNLKSREIKKLQRSAKEKRAAMHAEVQAEVMAEPVNQAYQFITRGEYVVPDGANKRQRRIATEIAQGEGSTKMSVQSLKEFYGETDQIWQQLPTGKYGLVSKEGIDFNEIADMFGFSSGDQMLQMLLTRENPREKIEAITDQRMLERYGDLSDPISLEKAADEAIHNDARTRFVATEMNALNKAVGGKKILTQAAKQYAEAMIARLKIRDVKPARYTAAEARAGREADKARKAGDLKTAAVEKRNQFIQMAAAKSAMEAQDRIEKDLRYLKKFERPGTRKNIDAGYIEQIDALMERFDLKKSTSLKDIDKRKSLTAWMRAQEDLGIEPDVPEDLLNAAYKKHYKDMTVEELRGLVDTVKQIEHLGRLKNKLLTLQDQRQFNTVIEDLVASIRENYKGPIKDNTTRANATSRAKMLFRGYLAQHRKVASLSRQMDGVKDGGAMWEVFVRSMNKAGDTEASMRAEATEKLAVLSAEVAKLGQMGGKGVYFPSLARSLNREERIAVVLNMGNAGNMQRLLDGKGWTREAVQPVIDSLSAAEVKFVQDVWDLFDSYRPQIGAKERRVNGVEPEWVEPVALQTPHGELKGGYYPIKYDTRQSAKAEQHDAAEQAKQQLQGAYTSATTRRSFVKTRAEEVHDRPLLLTMDGLYGGLNEVIHDLSWHEWLIDANRLLRSKRLTQAILDTQGAEVLQQYKTAVKDIAAGEMPHGAFEKVSGHLRAGATVAGLGLSVSTALINTTGLAQSFVRVGPRWVMQGIGHWINNPVSMVGTIYGKSDFMRLRGKTMQRELNEIQSLLRDKTQTRAAIDKVSFLPLVYTQVVVDAPTWWGAYQKALAEGNVEERAVALADQAVIDAQGGGQVKDLAAIQRGGPMLKLWTVFYSYFSTTYQLTVEQTSKTNFKDPMDVLRLGGDYFMLYIIPAALGSLIRGLVSGDDDWAEPEKLAQRYINEQMDFVFGTLVGLRETTSAFQKALGVSQYHGGYSGPAGLRFYNELDKLGEQAGQGELDQAFRRSLVNVAGVTLRLPSAQANRTLDGMTAIMDGDTQNPAALIFGPPRE